MLERNPSRLNLSRNAVSRGDGEPPLPIQRCYFALLLEDHKGFN